MRPFVPRSYQSGLKVLRPHITRLQQHCLAYNTRHQCLSYARSAPAAQRTIISETSKLRITNFKKSRPLLSPSQKRQCSYRNMCRSMADVSGSIDITKNREVLPTNVVPRHYDLTLEPDFEKFTFEGTGELNIRYFEAWSYHADLVQSLLTSTSPKILPLLPLTALTSGFTALQYMQMGRSLPRAQLCHMMMIHKPRRSSSTRPSPKAGKYS